MMNRPAPAGWLASLSRSGLAVICSLLLLPFIRLAVVHAASSLSLSPETSTSAINTNKTFTVSIDTDGADVFGADIIISYPTTAFEYVSAANGSFFTDFSHSADRTNGILALHGFFASPFTTKSGTGTVATFTLKASTGTGNATVSYVCGGSGQTTQVINAEGTNIISCGHLADATVTFTGGSTPTPTATPGIGGGNPTPTPTGNPGNQEPACSSLSVSPSTGTKPLSVTFICSGSDPDNDLTAAEFSFGNTGTRIIEKNVGQHGTFSTTYTYSVPQTYLVSCRVRDNNGWWSQTPASCQKFVMVTQATGPTPTPARAVSRGTTGTTGPLVFSGATPTPIKLMPYATPTPIPEFVDLADGSSTGSADSGFWSTDRLNQLFIMLAVSAVTIAIAFALQSYFDKR